METPSHRHEAVVRKESDHEPTAPIDGSERWLPIEDCPGYEVSDAGRVRSFWLTGRHRSRRRAMKPHILTPRVAAQGRRTVLLQRSDGVLANYYVYRLVARAFLGPCPPEHVVAHLDGDTANNTLANLAYTTRSENERHKFVHGTASLGEKSSLAKLTSASVGAIRKLANSGVSKEILAEAYGVSTITIERIITNKTWSYNQQSQTLPENSQPTPAQE